MGGESRQKINLSLLIDELVADVKEVEGDEEMARKDKTTAFKRIAKSFKTKVHDDRRRAEGARISLTTYRRYMTMARGAITALNMKHHHLEQQVERIARNWPAWGEAVREMAAVPNVQDMRLAHRDLLRRIRGEGSPELYQAVRDMKLDHEIMRHLTLPAAQKSELAEHAVTTLEERSVNVVRISYAQLMETTTRLLTTKDKVVAGGVTYSYSYLALGLALATGRRAWEVLCVGRFKKAGRFELEFSGQAKKREGIDYSESYRIYTLIEADLVLAALSELRQLPEVVDLEGLSNTEFNRRTAKTLNNTAKSVFSKMDKGGNGKGEKSQFKDSRAIWARVVFETHFAVDPTWHKTTEEVFWRAMLGHEDMETQLSYRAFKIDYQAPEHGEARGRLAALKALDDAPEIANRAALQKVHEWAKGQIEADPGATINQNRITLEVGTHRQAIKDYLALAREALEAAAVAPDTVAAPVPEAVKQAKPKLVVVKRGDEWVATATVNGIEVARASSKAGRVEAMKEAYETAITLK